MGVMWDVWGQRVKMLGKEENLKKNKTKKPTISIHGIER